MNICDEGIYEGARKLGDLFVKCVCFAVSLLFVAGLARKIHHFAIDYFSFIEFRAIIAIEAVIVIAVAYLVCQALLWIINCLQRNFSE